MGLLAIRGRREGRFPEMKKQSLWLDTVELPEYPKLEGNIEVDVAIVGAGITGLTTAYLLKEAGCKVAVVDLQGIAGGETGHTTAHLSFVTDARLSELAGKIGKKQAAAFWDAGLAAMAQIEGIARELKVDCELKRVPGYLFAALGKDADKERKALEKDAELAAELGFDADLLQDDPVFERPAVRFPNQLKFHPLKYLEALVKKLPGQGSHVFTKTSGSDVDAEKHELRTKDGMIKYGSIVAATHVPIQGERGTVGAALFQTKLAGYSTYAIEAGISCIPESLFWDTNEPYYYFRFDRREDGCSVIVGGEDHKTGQAEDTEARYEALLKVLRERFPSAKPRHRWSGQVIETPDGLPYIGEVGDRQFAATGFSGNGMTLGTFSAMLIRDLITKKANPWSELFSPDRKALVGAWEYLRENVDFPKYFIKDHVKPAGKAEDVSRNSGEIVRIDGKKRAIYCDAHGKRTVLSPVCPHMGCIVAWNEAEKTWDCPCHGSRFMATGEVIAGPAESNLEAG